MTEKAQMRSIRAETIAKILISANYRFSKLGKPLESINCNNSGL